MPAVETAAEAGSESATRARTAGVPFIHKFKTDRNAYVYDVNSGEIIRVDDVVWQIIEDSYCRKDDVISKYTPQYTRDEIARAYDEICTARDSQNLFLDFRPEITMPHSRAAIRDSLNSEREQLILNVTERCNFRCDYCSFTRTNMSWRSHGQRDMSWETARAAIDEFLAHCRFCEAKPHPDPASDAGSAVDVSEQFPPAITFYGGEPLLNFPLIKKCVEYTLERVQGQRVCLALTTNGYLLKGNVAKFLATHGVVVKVSLDGPASVHDQHRRTADGLPTWSTVVENLKAYYRDYPDYHAPGLAVTIPRTVNLLEVQDYLTKAEWIPDSVHIRCRVESEPEAGYFDRINYPNGAPDGMEESSRVYHKRLIDGWGVSKTMDREFNFQSSLFDGVYRDLYRRGRTVHCSEHQHLPERYAPFTTCVAGARRTFASVDGHYYPCERVPEHEDYRIGSVSTGIDLDKVYMLAKYFTECTHVRCRNCWALRTCRVGCYSNVREGTTCTKASKERICEESLQHTHNGLVRYCEILERNPHAFDHLSRGIHNLQDLENLREIIRVEQVRAKAPKVE